MPKGNITNKEMIRSLQIRLNEHRFEKIYRFVHPLQQRLLNYAIDIYWMQICINQLSPERYILLNNKNISLIVSVIVYLYLTHLKTASNIANH